MFVFIEEFRQDNLKRSAGDPVNRRRRRPIPVTAAHPDQEVVALVHAGDQSPEEGILPPETIDFQDGLLDFGESQGEQTKAGGVLQMGRRWVQECLQELAKELLAQVIDYE